MQPRKYLCYKLLYANCLTPPQQQLKQEARYIKQYRMRICRGFSSLEDALMYVSGFVRKV